MELVLADGATMKDEVCLDLKRGGRRFDFGWWRGSTMNGGVGFEERRWEGVPPLIGSAGRENAELAQ